MMLFKGKRGTVSDVIFLAGAGFLALFFGLMIVNFVGTQTFTVLTDNLPANSGETAFRVINQGQALMDNLDRVAITAFFGLLVTFIITSWATQGRPVLVVAYFFLGVISIFMAMLTSNFWEDITANAVLADSLAAMPFSNHVMLNLPLYIVVFWIVGLIVTFAKPVRVRRAGSD